MSSPFVNLIFFIMAIVEIVLGIYVLATDRRSWRNIGLFFLLLLFGLGNIATGALYTSFILETARIWMAVRVATAFMIGPSIYLASVMILRPSWLRHRWIYLPVALIAFIVPILVGLDLFLSGWLPQALLFSPPQAQAYAGGLLPLAEMISSSDLQRFYFAGQIFWPILAVICPMLVVAFTDRQKNRPNSRTAWVLAIVSVLPLLVGLLRSAAATTLNQAIMFNGIYLAGFLWIMLRGGEMSYGLAQTQKALNDWQVLTKLMLAVLTIMIPAVLIITLVASAILRTSLIQEAGKSQSTLASLQAGNLGDELQSQIANLQRLSEDPDLAEALRMRAEMYDTLEDDQVQRQISDQEFSWVSTGAAGEFRQAVLIGTPRTLAGLYDFLATFPNFELLMLADAQGALVTATDIPGHYDFSNAGWWREAISLETGRASISPPSTSLTDGTHFVRIAIPVRDADTGLVIGVLLGDYALRNTLDKLLGLEESSGSHSDLYGPSGIMVPHHDAHSAGMLPNGAPFLWDTLLATDQPWQMLPFDGQNSIVSWSPVGNTTQDQSGIEIGWRLAAHQPVEDALSSLAAATRATAITSALALLLVIALTYALANYITSPLAGLARMAERIREGDLFVSAPSERKDEFGSLAATFNTMTSRLREMVSSLESQVKRRTSDLERQTRQLQAAVQVGQAASTILNQENMLQVTVDVIRENFDFYFVGLFLVDSDREWAVLQAGTDDAGRSLLEQGHRLRVGEGMVGWSIQNAQARIARQAEEDRVRLQTSELPDTLSEAALPLRARGQILGALTVQSDRQEEFSAGTISILQTMADQVAISIDNANLLAENRTALEESQKALETVRRTYEQISREAWTTIASRRSFDILAAEEERQEKLKKAAASSAEDGAKTFSLPLKIRDFSAGTIQLKKSEGDGDWSEDEIQLMRSYVDQLGLTLESARLFQDTQLRSVQLQTSAEISQAASSILNLEELLPRAVDLIGERFALYYAGIFLMDDEGEWADLKAGTGEAGRDQLAENHRLKVGGNSMVGQCIANGKAQIALDVGERAVRFDNPHLPDTRTEMAIPLTTRGETIGALTIQSIYPAAFSSEDVRVFQTMADQLANAIQNARLYARSQESAENAQRQGRISQALVKSSIRFSQTQDEDQVYEIVSLEIEEQIQPDQVNIFTWEESDQAFRVKLRHIPGNPEDGYEFGQLINRQDRPDLWDVFNRNSKNYNPEKRADGFVHEQYRLPLLLTGKPFGVVEAYHTGHSAQIREEDQRIIDGIILQADVALQNARAFHRMQEALSRTDALYRVGQAAIAADEVNDMLQTVVETIQKALPADQVVLFTIDHDEKKVVHFLQTGRQEGPRPKPQYGQLLDGFSGWVLREGKPILSTKGKMDRRENERIQRARQAAGFGSVIVVPLNSRGRTMGAITVMNAIDKDDFTPQDTDLLLAMANQTAVAVQNAELLQETQKTAENETRLNQIGTQLIQSMDVDTILRTAVEEISRLPNVKTVSLTLGDSEAGNGEGE